jgi:acetylornithine deacetylase
VDPVAVVAFARELIDIDSTTGREGDVAVVLSRHLGALGYSVREQALGGGRFNIIATTGDPVVMFSTHLDCVPPFFPSRVEGDLLYGRGSADAKGILVAQLAACERLRRAGETRVGLLFVCGEERGSDGAMAANARAISTSRYLVNGEPTDNRLGAATRGVYRLKIVATGRAAHSSRPDLGESAIEKIVDAIVKLRGVDWPADALLGRTFYTIGLIAGGVAPNVIPAEASAEIMFRSVGEHAALLHLTKTAVGSLAAVEEILVVPPVRLKVLNGFDTAVFAFTTDIPFLDRWGAPLLLGPGSVELAHTTDEHVRIAELHQAVGLYERIATALLSESRGKSTLHAAPAADRRRRPGGPANTSPGARR